MNIDNKLLLKSFLSENRMNQSGVKTSLSESAVAGTEKNNVDLNLQNDDSKNPNEKSKKKKNKDVAAAAKSTQKEVPVKSDAELKLSNLKKLNLL